MVGTVNGGGMIGNNTCPEKLTGLQIQGFLNPFPCPCARQKLSKSASRNVIPRWAWMNKRNLSSVLMVFQFR